MFEEKVRKASQKKRLSVNKSEKPETIIPVQPYRRGYMGVKQFKIGDAEEGARVIKKQQKEVYTIKKKSVDEESPSQYKYDLQHLILEQVLRGVSSEDDRYDVYTGIIPSPTLAAWPDWQENGTLGEANPESIREIVNEVTKIELENEDKYAFYNAANIETYIFHRILKIIYENLNRVSTGNFEYFRAPNTSYSKEVFASPAAYVMSRYKGWSDHSDKASLIATNISLLGNRRTSAEDTLNMFFSNGVGGVDKVGERTRECLYALGFKEGWIEPIMDAVENLINNVKGMGGPQMVLYQIMIPKELVSKLIYISTLNGYPVNNARMQCYYNFMPVLIEGIKAAGAELDNGEMMNIEAILKQYQKEDLTDFVAGPEFAQIVLEAAKSVEFWKKVNSGFYTAPQARILLNPDYFTHPDSGIQVYTHKQLLPGVKTEINKEMFYIRNQIGMESHDPIIQPEIFYRRKLLMRLKTLCDVYYQVKAVYGNLVAGAGKEDTDILKRALMKAENLSRRIEAEVQTRVFIPLENNEGLLEKCLINSTMVKCQGKEVPFDTYIPFQMEGEELVEFANKIEGEMGTTRGRKKPLHRASKMKLPKFARR